MATKKTILKKHKHSNSQLLLLVVLTLVVVIAVGAGIHHHYHNRTVFKTTTTSEPAKIQSTASKGGTTTQNPVSQSAQATIPATTGTNVTLQKPSGSFVGNHYPGQNGSNQNDTSVCITTPGASCYISFAKDGITKSLPVTTTDDTGSAYWTWTPQTVGLTSGKWVVSAVATLGRQSAATQDPIQLEVSQ